MTRIVSGFQTQGGDWDGGALLRGYKEGAAARKAQEDAAQQGQMEQMRMMLAIKGALMEQERFDLAREKEAREAEQMRRADVEVGKAGKLQQFAQRAQAGQVNPGQKFVERVIGARGRLSDPEALAVFDASVKSLLETKKAAEEGKAFDDAFAKAQKDTKVFKPEQLQGIEERLRAGESKAKLAGELGAMRVSASEAKKARMDNEKGLAEAFAAVEAAPEGYGKHQAWIILDAIASSDAEMETPGSAAKAAKAAAEAMLGPRDEFNKSQGDPYADRLLFTEAYNQLEGEGALPVGDEEGIKAAVQARMRMMNSGLPAPQAQMPERTNIMKVDGTVRSILKKGGGIKEIRAALEAQGIQPTEDLANMVQYALRGYTSDARNASADAQRR